MCWLNVAAVKVLLHYIKNTKRTKQYSVLTISKNVVLYKIKEYYNRQGL